MRATGSGGWVESVLEEVLTPSYWFDPGDGDDSYSVTIWFSGKRVGVSGKRRPGDKFAQAQTVEEVMAGSGPVAVTTEVRGINPGEWMITARSVKRGSRSRLVTPYGPASRGDPGRPKQGIWPRRTSLIPPGRPAPLRTALLAFTPIPGVIRGAWAVLVLLGIAVGLLVQALLLADEPGDLANAVKGE